MRNLNLCFVLVLLIINGRGYPLLPEDQYAALISDQSIDFSQEKQVSIVLIAIYY